MYSTHHSHRIYLDCWLTDKSSEGKKRRAVLSGSYHWVTWPRGCGTIRYVKNTTFDVLLSACKTIKPIFFFITACFHHLFRGYYKKKNYRVIRLSQNEPVKGIEKSDIDSFLFFQIQPD